MNRITEIEIAGKSYPLNFSIKAVELMSERYGDLTDIEEVFKNKTVKEITKESIWMLSVLLQQGVAYKKIVDGEDMKGFTEEELEVVLGTSDFVNLKDQIMAAMSDGSETTVETEDDPKNVKTTQGK